MPNDDPPMTDPPDDGSASGLNAVPILLAGALALVALGIAGYLSVQSMTGSAVAGCGGDSGCGAVLASPWSKVGPVPVSLMGMVTYIAVLGGLGLRWVSHGRSKLADLLLLACAPLMLLAAGWFTYVQAVKIEAFCPYCMIDHGLGVVLGLLLPVIVIGQSSVKPALPLVAGVFGVAGLVAVQSFAPADVATTTENPFVDRDGDTTIDGQRFVSMFGGELRFELEDELVIGNAGAKQVVGVVFDYACPLCRGLHELLEQAVADDPSRFAVVALPLTMFGEDNPYTEVDIERFAQSKQRARLALAVAAIDREKWKAFDHWMFAPDSIDDFPRSIEEARDKAVELVGEETLNQQLTGEAAAGHDAVIDRNMQLLTVMPEGERYVPIMTAPGAPEHLIGRVFDPDNLDRLLIDAEAGLLPPNSAGASESQ